MRFIARIATVLILLTVILGPPAAAGLWLAHHRGSAPTLDTIKEWLAQPRTPADLIIAVLLATALLWLLLVYYLGRHVISTLERRWRQLERLPLPTPAQVTAGSMAGIAALALPAAAHHTPAATTTATAAPPPADPDSQSHSTPSPEPTEHTSTAGIVLPGGGWIPYSTALTITALITLLEIQRRRSYRPVPYRVGTHRDDADLQAPPLTSQAVAAALADSTPMGSSTAAPVAPHQLPAGVLYLHGPGAHAAARGLLVTAALTAANQKASAYPLAVRRNDWLRLLPTLEPTPTLAGLIDDTAPDIANYPAPPQPQETALNRRTVIVLDDPGTPAHRWHVGTDGTATGTTARRLCTLDQNAATHLLRLVLPHHTDTQSHIVSASTAPEPKPEVASLSAAKLTLLGDCTLTIDSQPIHLPRTAGMQILTYLAIHPEGATRTTLIEAIWPHLPPARITQRLHTTLSDVRRQLRPIAGDPVIRHGDTYLLSSEAIDTDLREWRNAVRIAAAALSPTSRADACERVVQLYLGELAAGQQWPWITAAREAARRDALDACVELAYLRPEQAVHWLTRATTIDPYNAAVQHRIAQLNSI
ncbi:AfsR/SARP family transcriptional regulator [Nucisporomicrobium flavum]|uniref:AfsR/SARP family transcriptional regulator n=1 Tax=Nucisporomicrobium flavum TaxID=2785915 RepID=UPI003C2E6EF9